MSTYYLASSGNDANSGTTPASPWRTIHKLNQVLDTGVINGGDSILFKRGDLFYGSPVHSGHFSYPNNLWLTYGAYGDGPKPRISCYKIPTVGGWQDQGGDVWRIDLTANSGTYGGATDIAGTNVGHIRVDGVIYGRKRDSLASLSSAWDFYSGNYSQTDNTNGYVYVKSTGNPSSLATVEISVDTDIINIQRHRTRIQDLELYGGDMGIAGNSYWSPHDVVVTGCDVHDVGGAYLFGYQTPTRGGNGIQAWIGSRDWLIERNNVYNAYDVAITYQGGQGVQVAGNRSFQRVHSRRNRIWNCCQSFEVWTSGTDGEGLVDCSFTDNMCFGAGRGWGQAVRPDPVGRGCHILMYEMQLPSDLLIAGNIFFDAATNYIFALDGIPDGVVLRDNAIFLDGSQPIQTSVKPIGQRSETISQAAAYVAATGHEVGSVWCGDQAQAEAYLEQYGSRTGRVVPTSSGLRHLGPNVSWPAA